MPQLPSSAQPRIFWCFISYRHADNVEPGRQWASWLHHAIETYEVPGDLVGTTNERGDTIPQRIYPVFRDEEELPVDADLASPIFRALDNSKFLLVICSPRAVESHYVAQEIRYFKQLGREDRVLAAMIDGIPNASHDPTKTTSALECFPEPLRHRVDAEGQLQKELAEPIAADFRLDDASQGWCSPEAYRQALRNAGSLSNTQIEQRVASYQQRCELMKLKIIAGVLGLPLGTLTQRDKAYQLELSRKRARRLRQWLAVVGVLGIVAIAGAVIARQQAHIAQEKTILAEQQAEIARQQTKIAQEQTIIAEQQRSVAQEQTNIATENLGLAKKRLAETYYKEASRLMQGPAGSVLPAVESLVSSLESEPGFGPSKRMLDHAMATQSWVVPVSKISVSEPILKAWVSDSGDKTLILTNSGVLQQFDGKNAQLLSSVDLATKLPKDAQIITAACHASQQQVALLCKVSRRRTLHSDLGDYEIAWSWQMYVFQSDGTFIGADALVSLNLDPDELGGSHLRSDRLADQPLFYTHDGQLLLVGAREMLCWQSPAQAQSLRFLRSHRIALLDQKNLKDFVTGWEYEPATQSLRFITQMTVLQQSIVDGRVLQKHTYTLEPDQMFPSPDDFSGMVSFGQGAKAAVSGLVDVSFQLPEGIGIGMPAAIVEAKEQYTDSFASYAGVFQFTRTGGWMHFHDSTFDYSAQNRTDEEAKGNFTMAFPANERITEWPPFLMRDFRDTVLLLSTVQSGFATPQLLEVIRKPKPDQSRFDIPTHQGISQTLNGKTCWISSDGSALAQIQENHLLFYRIGWRAPQTSTSPPAGPRPLSFCASDLEEENRPASPALPWQKNGAATTLQLNGHSFPLPANLSAEQVVCHFSLEARGLRLIVFQESPEETEPYEKRFRLWTIDAPRGTSRLSDPLLSFSVDRSESILATCDGLHVHLHQLTNGAVLRSFAPRRLSNHMIAPAQSVFFSSNREILGVGSLSSYQDWAMDYRAFDAETGNEFTFVRNGLNLWHFDLFAQPKPHELQEWKDGPLPKNKIPFFVDGYGRDMINALQGRACKDMRESKANPSVEARQQWTLLQWPVFSP